MGLRDRLDAAKRYLWSPMEVDLLGAGSDAIVRAGQPATVVVEVKGEDDGTVERIEVALTLNYRTRSWPLGEIPATVGRHELVVEIPADVPPSSRVTQHTFYGKLHRTKGTPSDGVSPVRVIGDPAHVYWPEGPRSEAGVISLDAETVDAGAEVSGRVDGAGKVEVGVFVDAIVGREGSPNGVHKQEFQAVGEVELDAPGPFRVTIPVGVPPTLHDGGTTYVTWEVRAGEAWHRFAVLDPESLVDIPEGKAAGLLDIFY